MVGRRGVGPDRLAVLRRLAHEAAGQEHRRQPELRHGGLAFVRFVYDGDASDTDSLASTGSGVVEDVFVDYFDSQGLASEPTAFDGRSDYDAFISVGIPRAACSRAPRTSRPQEAAIYGGTAGVAYDRAITRRATTSTTCRNTALDQMSDAVAHGTLTFAQTGSAVQGSDKGKALGHGDYSGSHLRK